MNLSGSLPDVAAAGSALQVLTLYNNQLTGALPASFGNAGRLENLDVSGNQLTGARRADRDSAQAVLHAAGRGARALVCGGCCCCAAVRVRGWGGSGGCGGRARAGALRAQAPSRRRSAT